jgi:hypothetical protein
LMMTFRYFRNFDAKVSEGSTSHVPTPGLFCRLLSLLIVKSDGKI